MINIRKIRLKDSDFSDVFVEKYFLWYSKLSNRVSYGYDLKIHSNGYIWFNFSKHL